MLQVGRCEGLYVNSWDASSDDRVSVSGDIKAATEAEAYAYRQQLLGYGPDADEPFVAVVWDEDPTVDGFYRVLKSSVDAVVSHAFQGRLGFSLSLERVRNFASSLQEIVHAGSARVAVGSWNLSPNWSGEDGTTGTTAIPGTSGTAAITNPTTTTPYGAKVLRVTWSVASTAAGGGLYQAGVAYPGFKYSAAVNRVRSSINNRLVLQLRFYDGGGSLLTTFSSPEKQVIAGTAYTGSDFVVEGVTAPASSATWRVVVLSIAGTGYANWSVSSNLETDGWVCNPGTTVVAPTQTVEIQRVLAVPVSSTSLRVIDAATGAASGPWVYQAAGAPTVIADLPSDSCFAQFQCPPAAHYEGAATLTFARIAELDVAVGRQINNDPAGWVLGNGEFEIRPDFGTELGFEFRTFDSGSATWRDWETFVIQSKTDTYLGYAGILSAFPPPTSIAVLRNRPAAVTIRLMTTFTPNTANPVPNTQVSPVNIDITLRRGDPYASIDLTADYVQEFHVMVDGFAGATVPFAFSDASDPFIFVTSPTPLGVGSSTEDLFSPMGKSWSFGVGGRNPAAFRQPYWDYLHAGSETQEVVA